MDKTFSIRRMKPAELKIATDWAQKEGWNPGIHDWEYFYKADPQGFFIGCLGDEPIATGSAVIYDDHFAFCGLYIVKPEYRNQGYGLQLTQERLKYIGNRTTGLDGVLDKVSKYERLGYVKAHKNIRYEYSQEPFSIAPSLEIVDLKMIPFVEIAAFDRKFFPASRTTFLKSWITQPDSSALGYVNQEKLVGYGVIRKCYEGYKIGPLFAETTAIAEALFKALSSTIDKGPIYLDVPEPNIDALFLLKDYEMKPKFELIRMYRNGLPDFDLSGIFGITTFELG